MGSEKIELDDGHLLFYGSIDQEDAQAAERAFSGRRATIEPWDGERGNLLLHASGCGVRHLPAMARRKHLTSHIIAGRCEPYAKANAASALVRWWMDN